MTDIENGLRNNMSQNDDFLIDDINLDDIDTNEIFWDRLIQEIINGNVVPVIGAEMLVENCPNIHQTIIGKLARKMKIGESEKITSFSELVYHQDYQTKIENIYLYVNAVLEQIKLNPSPLLKKLLSFRQFPFVITTSFTPVVENAMREIWGDDLRVLKFGNDPSAIGDIRDEADMRCPTVYYMFGRYCNSPRRYALTDTDMLDFCSSWLSDSGGKRPANLVSALASKYLLMIGNNYSDWLFRFIWYSLRKDKMGDGMVAYENADEKFLSFLDRTNAFARKNPTEVVAQIENRLARKMQENERTKFNKPEQNADIFISYSRKDTEFAEKLYQALSKLGKKVWYDRNDIPPGAKWMEDINRAINTAHYFVPILSNHIVEERNDRHVYRMEWDTAITNATSLGRTYIIPIASVDFNFYDVNAHIPKCMQGHNALSFDECTDWDELAKQILHIMNQI